jgi:bifunctional DNase/RNase
MRRVHGWSRIAAIALCGAALLAATGGAPPAPPAAGPAAGPQEVEVIAVVVNPETETPAVILRGKRDNRRFAMTIGAAEATGIAVPLRQVTPPRPLTHDLFLTLFGRLNVTFKKAVITDLRDNIYYATLYLTVQGSEMQLDSRPSDAIALAVRAKGPVYVEERVFEKSGRLPSAPAPAGPSGPKI